MRVRPLVLITFALAATPKVQAQIFYDPPKMQSTPLVAPEPGYGVLLPGANAKENQAALTWSFRSAINVAALQCGFDRYLRIDDHYNAMLTNHREELAAAFATLTAYFKRVNKTPRAAQSAVDTYGTRTYSAFSAVRGQLNFCTVSGNASRSAIFAPRGSLNVVAKERLRELYDAVKSGAGEQQFRPTWTQLRRPALARMDESCWKKGKYVSSCGLTHW